jgi:hypothetical protein
VVEKAVSTLGEAPQGLRDVFELCRGFEKAFSNIVNVSGRQKKCSSTWHGQVQTTISIHAALLRYSYRMQQI